MIYHKPNLKRQVCLLPAKNGDGLVVCQDDGMIYPPIGARAASDRLPRLPSSLKLSLGAISQLCWGGYGASVMAGVTFVADGSHSITPCLSNPPPVSPTPTQACERLSVTRSEAAAMLTGP